MDEAKELEILRMVVGFLKDGYVGNQAVWENAGKLPSDQSDWGKFIVQKALEIAIAEAIEITKED